MFSCYGYTPEFKLNVKWQMTFPAKKINMDMIEGMVTIAALHWVDNCIPYIKHLCLLARHLGLVIRKIPVVELKSQLDSVWQYRSVDSFKQQIAENSDLFMELVLAALVKKG